MPYLTMHDDTDIYYKDWDNKDAQPVGFSQGWPLRSDNWEVQMFSLADKGYRVIAHERRGFGRSSQPWEGNNRETCADVLQQLFKKLDLKNAMLVGHSAGGGAGFTLIAKAVPTKLSAHLSTDSRYSTMLGHSKTRLEFIFTNQTATFSSL